MDGDVIVNVDVPEDEPVINEPEEQDEPEWQQPLLELANLQREMMAEFRQYREQAESDRQASLTLVPSLLETNTRLVSQLETMAATMATLTQPPPIVVTETPLMDTPNQDDVEIVPSEVVSETPAEIARPKRRAI